MPRVRVPATSANLGPGFDCLGLAVAIHLEVETTPADADRFAYRGQGALPDTPDNLIHRGFRAACAEAGVDAAPVAIRAHNPIPLARGLGSSSAALVAGAALADATLGGPLGKDGVFQLCARIEGHPDNVAPAVYGGFTVSVADPDGGFVTRTLPLPPRWRLLFGVPDFELPTERARRALPESYPRSTSIFTASRTALWTLAVVRDEPELLRLASQDALHEPFREPLVPGLARARAALIDAGAHAAFLSGAGPTLAAIANAEALPASREVLRAFVGPAGRILEPEPDPDGYRLVAVEDPEGSPV